MASPKSKPVTVSKEAAAKGFDEDRWAQYVRLSCIEVAALRGDGSAVAIVAIAADLEKFVRGS